MERINRLSSKTEKVKPVTLSVTKTGIIRLSSGLLELMGEPDYVEFVVDDGNLLIESSDPECGFVLREPVKGTYKMFNCKMVVDRFFGGKPNTVVVFTQPLDCEGKTVFEVKIPTL